MPGWATSGESEQAETLLCNRFSELGSTLESIFWVRNAFPTSRDFEKMAKRKHIQSALTAISRREVWDVEDKG